MVNVMEYVGIVKSIAIKFHKHLHIRSKYELDDLFQIGYVGLLKAAKRYDETKEIKFSTYAFPFIKYEIVHTMRDDKFYPCKDREKRMFNTVDSLDKPCSIFENSEVTRLDILPDNKDFTEEVMLNLAVNRLPQEYKEIIYLKYYLGKTQVEIAKILGSNQPKIFKIERKALKELREHLS